MGETPTGVSTTAFEFSSGILVTRGVRNNTKKAVKTEQAETKTARSRWGAPPVVTQQEETPLQQQQPKPSTPASASNAGDSTGTDVATQPAVGHERPEATPPPAHRQRGSDGKPVINPHAPPFAKFFEPFANQGKGDCFYISVAKGLNHIAPTKRPPAPKDFDAGGRLQASVRCLASQAASKGTFKATQDLAEKIGTSGQPADSLAVRLTADATKTDIYVWAKSKDDGSWCLFVREPGAKRRNREIFLKLEDSTTNGFSRSRDQPTTHGTKSPYLGGVEERSLELSCCGPQRQGENHKLRRSQVLART